MHGPSAGWLVRAESVGLKFRRRGWLFQDLDLEIRPGDRIAIVGPSGSGKSSLLGLLSGELRPSSGQIHRRIADRSTALVYQSNPVLFRRTAVDNVTTALLGQNRRAAIQSAYSLLASVGLAGFEERVASKLSGGELQRLCVARAFAQEPQLILADEPTGQLDAENSSAVGRLLSEAPDSVAVVVATHDLALASMFSSVVRVSEVAAA